MQKKSSSAAGSSTQDFLMISEIREDVIVTPDGGLRAVIAVSSTNFLLKSPDEQNAILARYQDFLNTLGFPVQILMQSRKLDVHGYLEKMRVRALQHTNELLRVQTEEYIEYISKLLEYGNIMNKTFFVVVPFNSQTASKQGFFDKLSNFISPAKKLIESRKKMLEGLEVLNDRVSRVENGLSSVGLRTMKLNTTELVDLLYQSYNIGSSQANWVDLQSVNFTKN